MTNSVEFFHMHKKRVGPEKIVDRNEYVARKGRHAAKKDLVTAAHANMPPGLDAPAEFCQSMAARERKNGGAYEYEFALPRVLSRSEYGRVAERVVLALAKGSPAIWGVHCPEAAREGGLQPHVHALIYPKVPDGVLRLDPSQIFARNNPCNPELGGWKKRGGGATRAEVVNNLKLERELACCILKEELAEKGVQSNIDHRSYAERGINKPPGKHLGPRRVREENDLDKLVVNFH